MDARQQGMIISFLEFIHKIVELVYRILDLLAKIREVAEDLLEDLFGNFTWFGLVEE
ncbi:MAG: hypothetical protein ACOYD6_07635 [Limnochordia bacterium]